jgi:protein-disulfide isomerase
LTGRPARRTHSSDTVVGRIRADLEGGAASGVPGTPAFDIDGLRHDGGWDQPTLLAALRAAGRKVHG